MTTLFTVLIILGSLGLILFVLVQNPKGGGLNADFGSAVQLGGAKRATDILEKGTWGLAVGIALICLIMAKDAVQTSGATEGTHSDIEADPNAVDDNVGQPAPAQPFNVPGNP